MKILIVGSNGGIASRLIPTVRKAFIGCRIEGIDIATEGKCVDSYLQLNLLSMLSNDHDSARLEASLRSNDVIIHLAAAVHDRNLPLERYKSLNIDVPLRLYDKFRKLRGPHGLFIFFSSIAVYGENIDYADEASNLAPVTEYARSKAEAEIRLTEQASVPDSPRLVILRIATVINKFDRGNLPRLVNTFAKYRAGITVGRGIVKTFVDVEDISKVLCKLMKSPPSKNTTLNIAGPPVDLRELLELVSEVTGCTVLLRTPKFILALAMPTLISSINVSGEKAETELGMRFLSFHDAFLREFP